MKKSATDRGRRKAIKKIAVSIGVLAGYSTMPERWMQPIIGNVVLPAHAATSGAILHDPCQVELRQGDNASALVIVKVTGFVTPPAANLTAKITATAVGGMGLSTTAEALTAADGTFETLLTLTGGPGITQVNATTTVQGASGTASCSVQTTGSTAVMSFNPCTLELGFGQTQQDTFLNVGVMGSVNPLTGNVPITLLFVGTRADNTTESWTINALTGNSGPLFGVYAVGIGPRNLPDPPAPPINPFVSFSVTVTSSSISGSTNCNVPVPEPN